MRTEPQVKTYIIGVDVLVINKVGVVDLWVNPLALVRGIGDLASLPFALVLWVFDLRGLPLAIHVIIPILGLLGGGIGNELRLLPVRRLGILYTPRTNKTLHT